MKKDPVTGLAPVGPRPSSVRRVGNLRALVKEFAERDIGCAAAALFLGCSLSAARNYVSELLDAGVIASHPVRQGAGCIDRTLYQLTADPLVVHRFLATLAGPGTPVGAEERLETAAPPGRVHRIWQDAALSRAVGSTLARRDPLVAALFGAPALDEPALQNWSGQFRMV